MKYMTTFLFYLAFMSFETRKADNDFSALFQNWRWVRYKAGIMQELTYKPSKEFGDFYGYQFRKDGTLSICRSVSNFHKGIEMNFEVVDGKWEISQDSIITVSYKSNNRSYNENLTVIKLDWGELVVHFSE